MTKAAPEEKAVPDAWLHLIRQLKYCVLTLRVWQRFCSMLHESKALEPISCHVASLAFYTHFYGCKAHSSFWESEALCVFFVTRVTIASFSCFFL